jgi:hypothetical protein
VALLVIEDAVAAFRDAVRAKQRRDDAAWAEAHRVTVEALSAAGAA